MGYNKLLGTATWLSLLGFRGIKADWQRCSIGDLSAFPAHNTAEEHFDGSGVCQKGHRDVLLLQMDQKQLSHRGAATCEQSRHKQEFLFIYFK